mmetsp:Transcript_43335/g.85855  ORF Transcript_43335/g.85855 Transcript_43335/m.85855 type:complete len:108 (-) Transcript_43335:664-987(-)
MIKAGAPGSNSSSSSNSSSQQQTAATSSNQQQKEHANSDKVFISVTICPRSNCHLLCLDFSFAAPLRSFHLPVAIHSVMQWLPEQLGYHRRRQSRHQCKNRLPSAWP